MLPRNLLTILAAAAVLVPQSNAEGSGPGRIHGIRFWSFGDVTRIAIETTGDYKLSSDQIENPWRVYFDLDGLQPSASHAGMQTIPVDDKRIRQIRVAEVVPGKTRIVFDVEGPVEVSSSQLVNPDRLMIEIRPKETGLAALAPKHSAARTPRTGSVTTVSVPVPTRRVESSNDDIADLPEPRVSGLHHPPPTSNVASAAAAKRDSGGDRSLVRVFGLKLGRVVIDAGHGGKDTGTIGPNGLMEKDLVLDVALRLGRLINDRLGADVVYTRSSDVFIPLEERTKIANDQRADLFISVHANSSPESSATGVETYYFNLTSDKKGLDLASRENATSVSSISDLSDMLHRAVLQAKLEESREFAQKVQ